MLLLAGQQAEGYDQGRYVFHRCVYVE